MKCYKIRDTKGILYSKQIQQESDTGIFTADLLELDIHMYVLD